MADVRKFSTRDDAGEWTLDGQPTFLSRDGIAVLFLADIRREARKQTATLQRIDERLKRNGMSLAKRNRK